jgi:putative phage-type endonuclease
MNSEEREKWLKERKSYLGGSDIGAIVGANPYRSALDVYLDKTSEGIVDITSEAAYWGNTLEFVIAEEYSKRTAFDVEIPGGLIRHKEYPFIAANIDRWANGRNHILECKTAGFTKAHEWGEVGTAEIPEVYKYQVAYYAAITGVSRVDIAVLIGGQDFRIYQYLKDKEMEDKLIRAAVLFWNKYILTNTPPTPKTDADTAKLFPKGNGLEVRADGTILKKVDMLQDLKVQNSNVEKEIKTLEVEVKNYMQDGELLIDDAGHLRATWKNRKGSKRLDTKSLEQEHNEIYRQYLKEGESYRVFALKQ